MAETTHTPTPWHQGPYYTSDVESRDGRICECMPLMSPRAAANAELIVRAVNAHDDLLAALKALRSVTSRLAISVVLGHAVGSEIERAVNEAHDAATAAIAKAEATHVG